MTTKTTKKMPAVRPIRHRGLVLRPHPGIDGYVTGTDSLVRVEVFRGDAGEWLATMPVGECYDCTGDGDTIGSAIDAALGLADRDLTDAIRSLTKERNRVRKVMRANP